MKMKEYKSALLREHYYEMRHRSGLSVYVFPKKLTSTYAILSTRYGAMDTGFRASDGKFVTVPDGVAHFLEHKLFENPDGSDSFAKFSVWGADANAYTTANRTAYLFSCTEHFSEALEELLTFVTTPYFTPETVKKEQGIIAEEIRMYDDSPWDRCFQQLMEAMYAECGIRKNICGTERSIGEITDRLLYDCYRIFYQLSNMALVVCGDVTPEEVAAVCDRILPEETERIPIVHRTGNRNRLQSRGADAGCKTDFHARLQGPRPSRRSERTRAALHCDESSGRSRVLACGSALRFPV